MKVVNCRLSIENIQKIWFLVLCGLIALTSDVQADPGVPEKLEYNVYWAGIRVGNASFEVDQMNGGTVITTRAVSSPFFSIFYKVEDMSQSILHSDGFPSTYILKTREGRHRKDRLTLFGPKSSDEPQKVTFTNKLDESTREFELDRHAFDPLSGFYEIRKRQLETGRTEYLDIFDSKRLWNVEVKILRKEKIRVPAGEYDTIVINPLLKSEGIFSKKGKIHIWLTDDEKKVPVMIKSKVKVGVIKAKLREGNH